VGLRQMQDVEEEGPVDRNLIGFPHAGSPSIVPPFSEGDTIGSAGNLRQILRSVPLARDAS
jgi:hypothetical protein